LARGLHIECPTCRGSLGVERWSRVTRCAYCDTPLLVEAQGVLPRYYAAPKADKDSARRSLQRALQHSDIPKGFMATSSLRSCELYFVPFHELTAKRVGLMAQRRENRLVPGIFDDSAQTRPLASMAMKKIPTGPEVDTRVLLGDVHLSLPAVELTSWGLGGISLSKARTEHLVKILPYDSKLISSFGRVLSPRLDPNRLLPSAFPQRRAVGDDTTYDSVRLGLVFYPVWRLRYVYRGRLYSATVDAVTGACLFLRAPQSAASRTHWLMVSALGVGLVLGAGLRLFLGLFGASRGDMLAGLALTLLSLGTWALVPASILAVTVVLVAEAGYEQFRYPGEVVIEDGMARIEKLGKPRTLLTEKLAAVLEKVFRRQEDNS
jgi:LSD1 subclass zinc finger protein